ncbi:MAG: dihydroorotase [Lentisphaerota bacterium]
MSHLLLRGGRLMDPSTGRDETADLLVRDGVVAEGSAQPGDEGVIIDASGLVVAPGFIDVHVHLREPGGEDAETILTGSRAAAKGGFTTVVAMPNTRPPLDTPDRVVWVIRKAQEAGLTRVFPAGCITKDRQGLLVADLEAMEAAGAAVFTDDGSTVMSDDVMEQAMIRSARLNRVIMDHAQDHQAEKAGVMHEGHFSRKFNLPGIPAEAEARIVERDIRLAEKTGCRLHIQHVSAAESVDLIASARERGLPVTGEVTPHHLTLTDADIDPANADFKMNPPLRSERDRQRLIEGLCEGTLTVLATDHAPHSAAQKAEGFLAAPFGIIGLETAIGITLDQLVDPGRMDLMSWIKLWTTGPAPIVNRLPPSLRPGSAADIVLMDLHTAWTIQKEDFLSLSRNSPFLGRRVHGKALFTLLNGRMVWSHPEGAGRLGKTSR